MILISYLLCSTAFSQSFDKERMDRDIEVAENVLSTLISQEMGAKGHYFGGHRNIEGSYMQNFGVVFRISDQLVWNIMKGSKSRVVIVEDEEDSEDEKSHEDVALGSEYLTKAFKTFLADYGNLITQLTPTDKIMVKTDNSRRGSRAYAILAKSGTHSVPSGVSAEISVSDIIAHEQGDLTREQLMEKIEVKETSIDVTMEPQLEVFSAALDRLYEKDMTDTYYLSGHPSYERVKGFGVTYFLKFYSSEVHGDDLYSLPTINKMKIPKKERDEIVNEMYPDFLDGLKKNILEYAHILKNIANDEMLVFGVKLTSCDPCDMPAEIELSLKKKVVEDYRRGETSLNDALASIQVKTVRD